MYTINCYYKNSVNFVICLKIWALKKYYHCCRICMSRTVVRKLSDFTSSRIFHFHSFLFLIFFLICAKRKFFVWWRTSKALSDFAATKIRFFPYSRSCRLNSLVLFRILMTYTCQVCSWKLKLFQFLGKIGS